MKFSIVYIGRSKTDTLNSQVQELYKRCSRFAQVTEIVVPDIKNATSMPSEQLKRKEAEAIRSKISDKDYVVLLDEAGKEFTSRRFAGMIEKHFMDIRRPMTFVIGGAFGFGHDLYERADRKISLSKMTFTHQLIRLIFAEQLYRALTIIKGHPYHND